MKFPDRKIQIAIISVGCLSLIWLAAWFAVGSGIPSGVSVSGIDIGGKTRVEAIKDLNTGEILLVAGKGHETTQTIGDQIFQFSDIEVALDAFI